MGLSVQSSIVCESTEVHMEMHNKQGLGVLSDHNVQARNQSVMHSLLLEMHFPALSPIPIGLVCITSCTMGLI